MDVDETKTCSCQTGVACRQATGPAAPPEPQPMDFDAEQVAVDSEPGALVDDAEQELLRRDGDGLPPPPVGIERAIHATPWGEVLRQWPKGTDPRSPATPVHSRHVFTVGVRRRKRKGEGVLLVAGLGALGGFVAGLTLYHVFVMF